MDSIISDADYRAIEANAKKNNNDRKHFLRILKKTTIVEETRMPGKRVRLNSLVLLWHSFLKKVVKFRIVLPDQADLHARNISVFAPISMAILGRKESDHVRVRVAGIDKELRIIKVINR